MIDFILQYPLGFVIVLGFATIWAVALKGLWDTSKQMSRRWFNG